jgi:adenylylsulfate kinase
MTYKAPLLWFTGLSGAGKSTLSQAVYRKLKDKDVQVTLIDGDILRQGLCRDLGFSQADRSENIRRAGEVAKLFADSGILTLAAFMSPMEADRNLVRSLIGTDRFIEIYCKCSFATCESRDTKGLYKKARAGELKNFIGMDAPYEEPVNSELIIETDRFSIEESADLIMKYLKEKELLTW